MDRPVFYVTRMVPNYRVPILERLNEALDGRLIVCHGAPPHASSHATLVDDTATTYRRIACPNYWPGRKDLHVQNVIQPFRVMGRPGSILCEESPRSIHLAPLALTARSLGIPIILWGHFSSNRRALSDTSSPAQRYRLWLAGKADACVCYTEEIRRQLAMSVPSNRLFTATNTLDIDPLLDLRDRLAGQGKSVVRQRLRIPAAGPVIAYVGRLTREKGVSRLPTILKHVKAYPDVTLVVVGDGSETSFIDEMSTAGRETLVHTGPLDPIEAARYIFASDIVLLPGFVGLAVNHAFAMGRPVVTEHSPDSRRYHGPEIAYVVEGQNAVLAPFGDDRAVAAAVDDALADLDRLSDNALSYAKQHLRPQQMVEGLANAIHFAEQSVM